MRVPVRGSTSPLRGAEGVRDGCASSLAWGRFRPRPKGRPEGVDSPLRRAEGVRDGCASSLAWGRLQ